MRKSWPFALAVIVVGGLAGVAIAGRPVPSDPFVLDPIATTDTLASLDTVAPVTTTTVRPSTTEATTTTEPATTTVDTSPANTAPATTTEPVTTSVGPLPRNQVELVIANGDGRFRLASVTADRLRPLGYIIDLVDTLQTVDKTIIYYRPGFDDEAEIVAQDILVPDATIAAFPPNGSLPITNSDDAGNVIVMLGPDAPR